MKILVLLILISVSQSEASNKSYRAISPRAPNISAAQMLNWEQFKLLPVEKKIQYIEVIKQFLLEQEAKWPGKRVASFSVDDIKNFIFPSAFAQTTPEIDAMLTSGKAAVLAAAKAATDNQCPDLPSKFQTAIGTHGNHCIKAGYLICLTYSGGTLKCDSKDPIFTSYTNRYCKGAKTPQVACSPPLFIGKDGGAICAENSEAIRLKSTTQACIERQKKEGMDDAAYKAAVLKGAADKNFKPSYDNLKNSITDYCTPENGKRWNFDDIDCGSLTAQLAKIDPAYDNMAKTWAARLAKAEVPPASKPAPDKVSTQAQPEAQPATTKTEAKAEAKEEKVPADVKCNSTYKIPAWKDIKGDEDQVIKLQLKELEGVGDNKYVLGAQDRKGWTRSLCDGNGRIDPFQKIDVLTERIGWGYDDPIDTTPAQKENSAPCMVKISGDEIETLHFEGKSDNDTTECGIHLTRYKDGTAVGESKCSVPSIEGYSFQLKKDDSGVFSGDATTGALVKSAGISGLTFYQVPHEAGKPFRQLFYAPTLPPADKPVCYASVMDTIGPQTKVAEAVAPGAAPASAPAAAPAPQAK
jgi:hypothetical protein